MNNQSSGQNPLLLLVEDEQDMADLVTLIMKEQGYQVLHAADGSVALEKIALMSPPSLVMLDIQLPPCGRHHDSRDHSRHTGLGARAGDHVDGGRRSRHDPEGAYA